MLPNFLIGGAPKAGTTSVFTWLRDHPEVATSSVKETRFFYDRGQFHFNAEANCHDHPMARYEAYFAGASRSATVVLEASPGYLHSRTALAAIPALASRPRVAFILRKPSERLYSSYRFAVDRMGRLDPGTSFSAFVSDARAGRLFYDPLETSRYLEPVSRWLDAMGPERVKVLLFDDLRDDPARFMKELSAFAGIDGGFWDDHPFARFNPTLPAASPSGAEVPYPDRSVLAALDAEFAIEVQALARRIGRNLAAWTRPAGPGGAERSSASSPGAGADAGG